MKEVFGTKSSEVRSDARKSSSGVSTLKEDSNVNKITTCGKFTDEITKDKSNEEIRHEKCKAHEDSNLEEGSRVDGITTFTDVAENATVKEVTKEMAKNIGRKKIKHEECNTYGESIPKGVSHANETTAFGEVTGVITKEMNSKASRHEKFQAHKQKLYKDAIRWKQIVRSEQIIDNSKREASISQLTIIFEESEKETETRHTATYDDRNKEASTITTKNENNKQMKFGTGYVNGRKISSIFDSCSTLTVIHQDIILETDEVDIETAEVKDQDDEILWENPAETDIDAVMKTDMNTGNSRLIMKQRAVANKLHFPFDNEDTSHCSSHTKTRDNTRQIEEESVTFPYKVGYGYRMPAWYIMNNNYRNLPASDELQSRDERKIVAQLW